MKPMLNVGQRQTTTEKQIQLLLEKGYDIFVLRLRKITEYSVPVHGFDDIVVRQYKSPNSMEVSYRLEMHPSSYAEFEPNEEGVATAYVAGTQRNIDVIASHFYSSQFTIMSILTPSGEIPQAQAMAKFRKRAVELNIQPLDANGRPVQRPAAVAADIADAAPAKEPLHLPTTITPKTVEEAEAMAEAQVQEKYSSLIDYLKKKSPKGWAQSGEYKSVVKPEIESVQAELIKLAGLQAKAPADEPAGALVS